MAPTDLRLIRQVHLTRLDRARRSDSNGERIGAPTSLVSLGVFLHAGGAILNLSASEHEFGLDHETYVGFRDPLNHLGFSEDGRRFAEVILRDLRRGGDGLSVRMPSRLDVALHSVREAA